MRRDTIAHWDIRGHDPGCKHYRGGEPVADEASSHIDMFCECHDFQEPVVLANGTDVAWPAGWDEVQAAGWRRSHNLAAPRGP